MKITEADEQLLSLLREDARASTAEIARRLPAGSRSVRSPTQCGIRPAWVKVAPPL